MDDTATLIATDHIQVELTIRLGRTQLSIQQLSALRPDDVLALDRGLDDGVEICVGERVIARGMLVDDGTEDGGLAVKVLPAAGG
ncbi:MAG: hypothetical protein DI498_02810 [Paracoccus denitrificans]|nr:MAG: hypothetical protein DI498_02810 [Paracoccus denitrificans]PZO85471.1 MAG: hypothetical protein DI633_02810 [Paracoccus denitrificans]